MKSLITAFSFLTIIPLKQTDFNKNILKNSLRYYSVVGFFIGVILYLITFLNLNADLTTILILLSWVIITGGFHLDGLADVCDAIGSFKNRDKAFEIMKDSRIGAMGTVAISLSLIFKFFLIKNILFSSPLILMLSPVYGRYSINFLSKNLDYAKSEGLGKFIADNTDMETFIVSTIFVVAVTLFTGIAFIFLLLSIYIFLILISYFFHKKFNGVTGDMLGATVELTEIITMFLGVYFAS